MHGPGDDDDDQGPTGRVFLPRVGTGRVLAKKFGYQDGQWENVKAKSTLYKSPHFHH